MLSPIVGELRATCAELVEMAVDSGDPVGVIPPAALRHAARAERELDGAILERDRDRVFEDSPQRVLAAGH